MRGNKLKRTTTRSKGFSKEELSAMKERAAELKAESDATKNYADGEKALLAKIAEMNEPDRTMALRLHEIIKANAPGLIPRTWYGMPAYADKEGNVVCHFQSGGKFKMRYATLGFSDKAKLDQGQMWPVAFALKQLTTDEEAKVASLVRKAVG